MIGAGSPLLSDDFIAGQMDRCRLQLAPHLLYNYQVRWNLDLKHKSGKTLLFMST
jgi:hypothetical protein